MTMKTCRHKISLIALCLLLLTSCSEGSPEMSISFESDYSQLVTAIENVNRSLSDRMSLLDAAMESGLTDNRSAIALVRKAVESLGGDMEKKLAAVSEAVKSQGTSLETKLALIEAAADAGFADAQARQVLLQEALASLGGSLEEKMTALEAVVRKQTTDLDTKLDLIEAAVKDGLADSEAAQGLMKEALASLGGSMEQQLAAIDSTLGSQQTTLSAKLALIETALQEGFAEGKTRQELIQQALDSLGGSQAEKLAAIDSALTSQTAGLTAKLSLIEAALTSGFSSGATAIQQLQTTLSSLKGAMNGDAGKIDAIVSTLGTLDPSTGSVSAALSQILASVSGLSSYGDMLASIRLSLVYFLYNGHDYVEMGDGLKWAICNVGADNPWDYGVHFAWGETEPKANYRWETYKWGNGTMFTKYATPGTTLEPDDDAATANWGSSWRTPTNAEWTWLRENCYWEWTDNYNNTDVKGMIVTSQDNGNVIFLPAAGYRGDTDLFYQGSVGYYWSSSLDKNYANSASHLFFGSDFLRDDDDSRLYGMSVRPVSY